MDCKKIPFLLIPVLVLAVSCPSTTKPVGTEPEPQVTQGPVRTVVTKEQYDSTKEDVQRFIGELNQIIRRRDYNAWKATLAPEYFSAISSAENLRQISEQPAIKTRNIVLRYPEDYFIHVVVPSRNNSRVDDIEFISSNRVKAFTVRLNKDGEEERLLLYNLEKSGNSWKIIS